MDFLKGLSKKFDDPNFFTNHDPIFEYTRFDLKHIVLVSSMLASIIYLIRLIFEKFIATPVGKYLNVKDRVFYKQNPVLETYYAKNSVITDSVVLLISKETDIDFDECKDWLKARRDFNKPSQLEKFNESAWKFTFYLVMWLLGLYILQDKTWIWNTKTAWTNWPKQYMTDDVYIYYITEIAFYFSLLVSQFYDVRRKDFWQMFIHHIVTLFLLISSWKLNLLRIGCIVLWLHDAADPLMELAKLGVYSKIKKISEPAFGLFILAWLITRLTVFPYVVLYSTIVEAYDMVFISPFNVETSLISYYAVNVFLCVLQVMHIIWFYMILRIVYNKFKHGDLNDCRESDDGDDDSDHEHNE